MEGCQSVTYLVSMGSAPAGTGMTITGQQAADRETVESSNAAAITGATATIGSTVANYVYKAAQATITISSAVTDAETLIINGSTLTNATAINATALVFGATAGATGANGTGPIAASLSSLINNNFPNLAATYTTSVVTLWVKNTASTTITITSTGAHLAPAYQAAQTMVDIMAPGLNSTSEFVSIALSSAATSVACGITGMKVVDKPAPNRGQIVTQKNT
jgi:hypothetical protein